MPMSEEYTETKEYQYGQQAFEQGSSFLDNPYIIAQEPNKFFAWSKGWWDKNKHYENINKEIFLKEEEEINKEIHEQERVKEVKKQEEKYKKSKKGRAEEAGQGTLFG
jgi:hypothetical protein